MKFSIKIFVSKRDQIRSLLRIWSHLLKKSFLCSVKGSEYLRIIFFELSCPVNGKFEMLGFRKND